MKFKNRFLLEINDTENNNSDESMFNFHSIKDTINNAIKKVIKIKIISLKKITKRYS